MRGLLLTPKKSPKPKNLQSTEVALVNEVNGFRALKGYLAKYRLELLCLAPSSLKSGRLVRFKTSTPTLKDAAPLIEGESKESTPLQINPRLEEYEES